MKKITRTITTKEVNIYDVVLNNEGKAELTLKHYVNVPANMSGKEIAEMLKIEKTPNLIFVEGDKSTNTYEMDTMCFMDYAKKTERTYDEKKEEEAN